MDTVLHVYFVILLKLDISYRGIYGFALDPSYFQMTSLYIIMQRKTVQSCDNHSF